MIVSADRPLRWGILGAGGIAAVVGAAIAESSRSAIVAVAARDGGRAADFASRMKIPRSYGSYAELVDDPAVDVVYIATTHAHHHEHALLALRAGKPVLVEKAFTLNAAQAREVVAEARSRGLFCMEAMWMRLNSLVRRSVEIAQSGRIGEITTVRADLSKYFPFDPSHRLYDLAAGGGALLDLGVYPLHFVWMVLGAPSGLAVGGRRAPTGSDLVAALQLTYPNGAVAQVHTSATVTSPDTGLILGRQGWVRHDGRLHHPDSVTVCDPDGVDVLTATAYGAGYGPQIAEVERCLREGLTESPRIPLDETVAILELVDRARAELGVVYPGE